MDNESKTMEIDISLINAESLHEYSKIPISFEVKSQFRAELLNGGLNGISLQEESVQPPYIKDYDRDNGEGPTRFPGNSMSVTGAFL